jgi:hypothetical protein
MFRRSCLGLAVFTCLMNSAAPLAAIDYFPLPWDPSLPNQTRQVWESAPGGWVPGYFLVPTTYNNPYGLPAMKLNGGATYWDDQTILGPHGEEILTYAVILDGASIVVAVPNCGKPNPTKLIQWQITADQPVTPSGQPTTDPAGVAMAGPSHDWGVGSWYTYSGMLTIEPNPDREYITFAGLTAGTNISEILVKTVCTPEPTGFVLMGTGTLLLVALARRRRQTAY